MSGDFNKHILDRLQVVQVYLTSVLFCIVRILGNPFDLLRDVVKDVQSDNFTFQHLLGSEENDPPAWL